VFQVKLELGHELMKEFELPGLKLSPMGVSNDVVRYDLHLFLTDGEQLLKGNMVYDTDLFESTTIERMCRQFETLLQIVVAEPEVKLSALNDMLAEADREYQIGREAKAKEARLMKYKQVKRQLVEIPLIN
jgi:non-ribosomal peptide synthetase component F